AWQAPLGERVEGGVEAMARAPEDAGEREPPEPRRPARAQVPRGAEAQALLRRGRRTGFRLRGEARDNRTNTKEGVRWRPTRSGQTSRKSHPTVTSSPFRRCRRTSAPRSAPEA